MNSLDWRYLIGDEDDLETILAEFFELPRHLRIEHLPVVLVFGKCSARFGGDNCPVDIEPSYL